MTPSVRNIVAIETATETVGVAVRNSDGVLADMTLTGRRRHVETLMPALEHLLRQVGLKPKHLGAVAVDVGPGLFTGLRVGVAAAKGLAQSLGLGVVGLTSLEVLTAAAADVGLRGTVLACVDARRGEVFAAAHDVGGTGAVGTTVIPAGLFSPADLADALGRREAASGAALAVQCVGDGAARYADVFERVPGVVVGAPALSFPPPTTLLQLALARLAEGYPPAEPGAVVPLYMREADAKSNFARAERA